MLQTWWASYKRQQLLTLRELLRSPEWVRGAH